MQPAEQASQDSFAWSLTACPVEIPRWRRAVASALRAWGADAEAVELAAFGVTELLTNVVKHVPDRRCRLVIAPGVAEFRVAVHDRSPKVPHLSAPAWDAESGRGLWLLGELAPAWGCACFPGGKAVWFRCPLAGPSAAPAGPPGLAR